MILPVPVQNVVIPALHLDLGIFPWMFTAFEADVLTLDIALAERGTAAETDGRVFSELRSLHAKARAIKQSIEEQSVQLDTIQQQLQYTVLFGGDDPATDTEAIASTLQAQYRTVHAKHASQVNHLQKVTDSISTMESSKQFRGPCTASIEPVLQAHNIQRQAYHGSAFVGNHVHRDLKPAVIKALTSAPLSVLTTRCSELEHDATAVKQRYESLFLAYANCTAKFSHCNKMSQDDTDELARCIQHFLAKARESVVSRQLGRITPKLHLLESHVVPSIRRLGVGIGLLAEQGSETIHAKFNSLNRDYHAIPNRLQRLRAVAEQHLVATLPQHESIQPKQTRKRKSLLQER